MEATIIDADWILEGFSADDAPLLHNDAALVVVDGRVAAILPQAEAQALLAPVLEFAIPAHGYFFLPSLRRIVSVV